MLIPSLDLMNGKAVQLRQGKEKVLESKEDPLALARRFNTFGEVAVIDLDAALDRGHNHQVIERLLPQADCRVGGGLRTKKDAAALIAAGARKVIIGTGAFTASGINEAFLKELAYSIGKERIIIALDTRNEEVLSHGWTQKTGLSLLPTLKKLEPYTGEFLCTFVAREGMCRGTDLELVKMVQAQTETTLTIAGGITTLEEIEQLANLGVNIQLGMALYTGRITLPDAFIGALNWQQGLLPTITQDQTGRVLMLAYSSPTSLKATFKSGYMTYYSRSRKALWQKGATSGHTQKLDTIRMDCDGDALLATVNQTGPACHRGVYSCFGPKRFSLFDLEEVIYDRIANPGPGSYTARLTPARVREKIMEEAQELVEALPDNIIWEAADLTYHLLVLLAREGRSINDLLRELERRRRP